MPSDTINEKPPKRSGPADKKILDLLAEAAACAANDADYYAQLRDMARGDQEKNVLKQIRLDKQKHEKIFISIYYKLSGERPDTARESKPCGRNLQAEYEKSVMGELERAEFYKRIYLSFINLEIRDMLFDMLTDAQAHAVRLTYLCSNNGFS